MKFYWTGAKRSQNGSYAGFRARFTAKKAGEYTIRVFGVSWFSAHLDGEFLTEGPCRFEREHPEYEELKTVLESGAHVLAARVHDEHVTTRLLAEMPPFFGAQLFDPEGNEIELNFRCADLAYYPSLRRINPQLGWSEDCDLAIVPFFEAVDFDDGNWKTPVSVFPAIGELSRVALAHIQPREADAEKIAEGVLAENFGYENDDVPARFFLRHLNEPSYPKEGIWMRFDLGKVRRSALRRKSRLPRAR